MHLNNADAVLTPQKGGIASGFYAWAPEGNYDPVTDQYYIYWSDPESNNKESLTLTLYNTTTDLIHMSDYGVFYQAPFKEIDASIKKYKGDYYPVHNDSTGDNDTGKGGRRIYLAKADSLEPGAFRMISGALSEAVAKGPFLLHNFKTDEWYTYYDYYQKHKFGITTIEDIRSNNWTYEGICETMPWDEVRHGGAIAVTQKELDKILDTWCKEAPVTWDTSKLSFEEEGDLTLTGTLKTTGSITVKETNGAKTGEYTFTNPDNRTVEITVHVRPSGSVTIVIVAGIAVVLVVLGIFLKKKKENVSDI